MYMKSTLEKKIMPEHFTRRYEQDDAVSRAFLANQLIHGTDSISKESAKILMERGLRRLDDGLYTWNTDLRLRVPSFFNLLEEQAEHYVSNIACPHLIVKVCLHIGAILNIPPDIVQIPFILKSLYSYTSIQCCIGKTSPDNLSIHTYTQYLQN